MDTEKVTKVYSAYSGVYDLIFGKIFHDARGIAVGMLDIKPGDRILEVGVGTGLSLPFFPKHCRIIGIDLTGPMLRHGVKRTRELGLEHVHLQQMDATHMAFKNDHFDLVLAAYVMTAVPDPKAVLSEMIRVCRPGGRIVLLNHFSNGNRLVSQIEKTLSPLCARIGFRSDLSMETLLQNTCLRIEKDLKVKPLNYWHVVQCINLKTTNGQNFPAGTAS